MSVNISEREQDLVPYRSEDGAQIARLTDPRNPAMLQRRSEMEDPRFMISPRIQFDQAGDGMH